MSDQRLEPGTSLEFNNGSLASIGPSLKVFIAQGNNIDDVSKLSKLTELEEVDLSRNAIKESASLKDVFDKCKKLKKLSLLSGGERTLVALARRSRCWTARDLPGPKNVIEKSKTFGTRSKNLES